jgi:hypothetical protein
MGFGTRVHCLIDDEDNEARVMKCRPSSVLLNIEGGLDCNLCLPANRFPSIISI